MPTQFPPPVNVSPLIRFGRYSMLLAGLAYGAFWQSRYTKKELALKDIKAREKAARDERLAQEKAMRSAAEIAELERMAGGK
uniref:ATP synthase F(0) complex subunit e, mitochondrial n=1 Tax=Riptortus pedestris TaxID=329032 RepID=R4WSZ9_RIPPE|nr:unkown protein [Riptortus pedestris]